MQTSAIYPIDWVWMLERVNRDSKAIAYIDMPGYTVSTPSPPLLPPTTLYIQIRLQ